MPTTSEVDELTKRLEALTFEGMQNPKDMLYNAELSKVIKDIKQLKGSGKDDNDEEAAPAEPKNPKGGKNKGGKPKKTSTKGDDENPEEPEGQEEDQDDDADDDGERTPHWINTSGEETTSPDEDPVLKELGIVEEEEQPKAKGKAKAKPKAKGKGKPKADAKPKAQRGRKPKQQEEEPEEEGDEMEVDDEKSEKPKKRKAEVVDEEDPDNAEGEEEEEEVPEPTKVQPKAKAKPKAKGKSRSKKIDQETSRHWDKFHFNQSYCNLFLAATSNLVRWCHGSFNQDQLSFRGPSHFPSFHSQGSAWWICSFQIAEDGGGGINLSRFTLNGRPSAGQGLSEVALLWGLLKPNKPLQNWGEATRIFLSDCLPAMTWITLSTVAPVKMES